MTAAVWLGWFAWTLFGLSPSLGGEDSGEFATVAATLGIPHAPGYPLYALAGRLVAALPVGNPAFRLNLLSAAAMATAVAVLFALVRRIGVRHGASGRVAAAAGLAAALSFGLTRAAGWQAAISDKYAVHDALFALFLLALTRPRPAWPAVGLLVGLGLTHHLQTLYAVPALAWLAWRDRRTARRGLAFAAVLALAGASPKLLYPPVRAAQDPAFLLARPVTVDGLADYLAAGASARKIGTPAVAGRWLALGGTLLAQASPPGLALGLAGLVRLALADGVPGLAAALTAATGLGLAASLAITGIEFYLLPVVWLLALAAGAGPLVGGPRARRIAWAVAVVPVWLAVANAGWTGRNRLAVELDHGRSVLAGLPGRTVLFASGDDLLYPSFYLQMVEGFRPDVLVVPEGFLAWAPQRERIGRALPELAGLLGPGAYGREDDDLCRDAAVMLLRTGRPVALTNPSRAAVTRGLHAEVRDLVYELFLTRPVFRPGPALWLRERAWNAPRGALTDREGWLNELEAKYQRQYADLLANAGAPAAAVPAFRRALTNPWLPDREGAGNNLALALEKSGDRAGALVVYQGLIAGGTARPEIYLNAGNLLTGLRRPVEAREAYQLALDHALPDSAYAAYARARLGGRAPAPPR